MGFQKKPFAQGFGWILCIERKWLALICLKINYATPFATGFQHKDELCTNLHNFNSEAKTDSNFGSLPFHRENDKPPTIIYTIFKRLSDPSFLIK